MATLAELVAEVAARFERAELVYGHGTTTAWDEAVALVLGVTGLPDDRSHEHEVVAESQRRVIFELVERRIGERVPVAYLLGKIHYAGYEFFCEPGVVIPRSPISQLVAAGLRPWLRGAPATLADVCCGTGCLGILCAHAFPEARVTLVDLDPQAVALAQRNVVAHGLANRVQVVASDLFAQVPPGRFDVLISNPPYVDAVDMAALPAEYRHEPRLGLAGGEDGLDLVARLLQQAAARLTPDGLLVCEVGGAAAALQRRFPRLPFTWPDLPAGGEGVFVLEGSELHSADAFGQRA